MSFRASACATSCRSRVCVASIQHPHGSSRGGATISAPQIAAVAGCGVFWPCSGEWPASRLVRSSTGVATVRAVEEYVCSIPGLHRQVHPQGKLCGHRGPAAGEAVQASCSSAASYRAEALRAKQQQQQRDKKSKIYLYKIFQISFSTEALN